MTLFDDSNKDLYLKLITSRILKNFGYATWLEVDFFVSTYTKKYSSPEVTDFDVVGISFDGDDLPPEKESSYNVSLKGQKGGNKWSGRTSLRNRLSTS